MPYAQQIEVTSETQFNIDDKCLPNFFCLHFYANGPPIFSMWFLIYFVNDVYVEGKVEVCQLGILST
jgi:hypothetical protein